MSNSPSRNSTAAVIPFFNESSVIIDVVQKASKYCDLIIAVDDGSTNDCAKLIGELPKLELVIHQKNYGKGAALRNGLEKAVSLGFNKIITLDSDGQHDPDFIPKFIQSLAKNDVAVGNRMSSLTNMPIHRRLSNYLTSYLLSKKLGIEIFDSQCGFRAFRLETVSSILPESKGFEAETEMLIKAAGNNLKIGFVDIPTIYSDEKSKMKSWQTTKKFVKLLMS